MSMPLYSIIVQFNTQPSAASESNFVPHYEYHFLVCIVLSLAHCGSPANSAMARSAELGVGTCHP